MKELVCDMCGSNNIIKQDGLFVCQACNTKYSIEEARKMMFGDEVVEVEGTIKIDSSEELSNLYELARRARETSDKKYALEYYEKILIKDPNSWEAQFCVGFYRLLNYEKLNSQIISDFMSTIQSSVLIVKEKLTDDVEITQALAFMTNTLIEFAEKNMQGAYDFIKKARTTSRNIVGNSQDVLMSLSTMLFSYGDFVVDINDKSRNFAIGCWKISIERGSEFNHVFGRSIRKEHKNMIENYVFKIQQYNPQYVPPAFKKSITSLLW